jgi:cobalt-zinc-cadmium efflux system outer membrane protein
MVAAFEKEAQASEQSAIAARSLPDPQLSVGIQDFPVTGRTAFSPTEDEFTMHTIGIMREQVRRSKREAEAARIQADALVSQRKAGAEERHIRREIMIAWIDAVEARAKQKLLDRLIADLRAGRKVIEAAIPTGGSTPALALQADAEIGLEESQLADAKRAEARARAELGRWIGPTVASRPLPDSIPDIARPTSHGEHSVAVHPELLVAQAEEEAALRQIDVARQQRKVDYSWTVSVGLRPSYGQMVSAGVSIPLQVNRGNRQERLVNEAQARATAASLRTEDKRRELQRDYAAAVADVEGADAELSRLNTGAIPQLEAAFKAAEARYAGGGGTLEQPFAIVRRYIEVNMQALDAKGRRARAIAELIHVAGEDAQ